jgi:hypothetical protein
VDLLIASASSWSRTFIAVTLSLVMVMAAVSERVSVGDVGDDGAHAAVAAARDASPKLLKCDCQGTAADSRSAEPLGRPSHHAPRTQFRAARAGLLAIVLPLSNVLPDI